MDPTVKAELYARLAASLHLQPYEAYKLAFSDFLKALSVFVRASCHLLFLLLLPLYHLVSNLLHFLAPHAKAALLNAYEAQRNLPPHAVYLELALLAALLLCYLLKRHITRRRYVPRLLAFVRARRRKLAARWAALLERVRLVNGTLAELLPHLLFLLSSLLLARFCPKLVMWLAEGYAIQLLSVVYPVFGTIAVVQNVLRLEAPAPSSAAAPTPGKAAPAPSLASPKPSLTSPTSLLRVGGGKRHSSVDRPSTPAPSTSTSASTTTPAPPALSPSEALAEARDDLSHAAMYWVVFAVSTGTYTALSLVPFLGSYSASLHAYLLPCRLFFFLWLHLPMNATSLLFHYTCPLVLRLADSSFDDSATDTVSVVIGKLCSFLTVASMVGLCRPTFKDRATVVLRESFSLLPALVCLGMPGFFVNFGIVYASLLVPAANAAKASKKGGGGEAQIRWAKYVNAASGAGERA